ncbi:uncharacterized protein LOC131665692 [Phymastichus coffea]|uniref:uncharacterized protein LOC131665692 n=1 Tax=Phymastichus coffea TaxID=108790 RepID=UPI00273A8B9F|nr:uncharacterized protein LOC131665692 [Phymastichus coffea]
MRYTTFGLLTCFAVNYCWGETSVDDETNITLCVNGTRVDVHVNLLDKECLDTAENSTSFENENRLEIKNIDMDKYSACLLRKASLMDDQGRVTQHFNIIKIVENLYEKTDDKGTVLILIVQAIGKCRKLSKQHYLYFQLKTLISIRTKLIPGEDTAKFMKCLIDNQMSLLWCD